MKKIILSSFIMSILIFIASQIIVQSKDIMDTVAFSIKIWRSSVFPALFPFFVLSELLINYGFVELVGEVFKPMMNKIFKIKSTCAFIFVMSIISGFPSNSKYTRELYLQGLIDEHEATKILTFSHFSNPLFILGTISIVFLNNKSVGLLILFVHYITNIIIGLIFRNYHPTKEKISSFSIKEALINMNNRRIKNNVSFGKIISNALINSINTLLLILGVITMFLIITTIINNLIGFDGLLRGLFNGLMEMTQGLKYISILNIPLKLKSVIFTAIISFGGLSVHMQVISIISDTKIKYIPFLIARILHSLIASIMIYILFDYFIL